MATAEGNTSGWVCLCGTQLVGRCYFQFGDTWASASSDTRTVYSVTGVAGFLSRYFTNTTSLRFSL